LGQFCEVKSEAITELDRRTEFTEEFAAYILPNNVGYSPWKKGGRFLNAFVL
jgi:hypothetical protein